MGEAREVIDRMTECVVTKDLETLATLYAADAVAVTPEQGEIKGRDQVVQYLKTFTDAFPDFSWEPIAKHESGDTAVDEGWVVGTHTEPLTMPTGETVPATGKRVRLREVDIATVRGGQIVSHRFYYDQMDVLEQLGLLPQMAT